MAGITLGLFAALAIYTHDKIHENTERHRQQLADEFLRRTATSAVYQVNAGIRFVEAALADQKARQAAAQQAQLAAEKAAEAQRQAAESEQASQSAIEVPKGGGDYWTFIQQACAAYGCNASELYAVMTCESHGNMVANEQGSGAYGVMQFMSSTFYANCVRCDYNDPYDQIDTAARMFAAGQQGQWSCKG